MFVFAFPSSKGGVGRTSLVASLATILALRSINVLVIECDPQNNLSIHLGLSAAPEQGWAPSLLRGAPWSESALLNSDGVHFLPFGRLGNDDSTALERHLQAQPAWLAEALQTLDFGIETIVLIDSAVAPTVYARQALRAANFLLPVLLCEPASYITLPAFEAFRTQYSKDNFLLTGHAYIVNQVNATRPMRREVLALLSRTLHSRLLPVPIHQDDSVAEALAYEMTVPVFAPQSQAAHDLQGLADWLLTRVPYYAARVAGRQEERV